MTRPLPFALAFALGLAACQPADTPVGPEASEAPGAVEPSAAPASSSATPTSTDSVLVSPVKPGATATSGPDTAKAEDACGADKVSERWLNSLPTADVKSAIANTVGERPIRYYGEGDAITMDFSPQRLNVELGKDGRIKLFRCG